MGQDYAYRLQNYAYTLIMDDVGQEFDERLAEWEERGDDLVLYAMKALTRFQGKLEDIKKSMQDEAANNSKLAMFVISLLGGAAMSFFAGVLQHRHGPDLFGSKNAKVSDEWVPKGKDNIYVVTSSVFRREIFDPDLAKTKGKLLGDMGSRLGKDMLVDPLYKAQMPNFSALQGAIDQMPDSTDLEDMRTKLTKVWRAAKLNCKAATKALANTIRDDVEWGDRLWAQLKKLNPKATDLQRFQFGARQIRLMVNMQRTAWSTQDGWFYYANQPTPLTEAQAIGAIEVELWAQWIALERYEPLYGQVSRYGTPIYTHTKSRSGLDINKVAEKLMELGVVQVERTVEFMRRAPNTTGKTGVQPVEIKEIDQSEYGELIDRGAEVLAITNWAKNRKPQMFGSVLPLRSMPRALVPLAIKTSEPQAPLPDPPSRAGVRR